MPSARSGISSENLEKGSWVSKPIVINKRPIPEEINPLSGLFPAREEIMVRPKTPKAKYSYDSKDNARDASGTENKIRIIVPTRPPIVEAVKDVIRAWRGFPCFVNS